LSGTALHLPFLMRDPLCWMASFLYKDGTNIESAGRTYRRSGARLWQHWLDKHTAWRKSSLRVNFDRFVADIGYRQELASAMGRTFSPEVDRQVMGSLWHHPAVYAPSSFDTERVRSGQIQPGQMKVLERWQALTPLLREPPPDKIMSLHARWLSL
jgi:hypothetical protein